MKPDAISTEEVWSEDRDILFANRLSNDIAKLIDAGVPNDYIKKVIGQFDYVRVWAQTPKFLFPAKSLPKGYKWGDGIKKQQKAGKQVDSRTIIFLPAGKDLYIKGYELIGTNPKECKCVYIKDYAKYTAREIYIEFMHDRMMRDMILKFWHDNKMPLGWVEYMVEPGDICSTCQGLHDIEYCKKKCGGMP